MRPQHILFSSLFAAGLALPLASPSYANIVISVNKSTQRMLVSVDGVTQPAPAPRFSRTPATLRRSAPPPGRDSREALADWGFASETIAALESSGAMAQT